MKLLVAKKRTRSVVPVAHHSTDRGPICRPVEVLTFHSCQRTITEWPWFSITLAFVCCSTRVWKAVLLFHPSIDEGPDSIIGPYSQEQKSRRYKQAEAAICNK